MNRANELDGKSWIRNSISVWSDLRLTKDERALHHPALFPVSLVERLIACFTNSQQRNVLDPFCGSGSTLVAAYQTDKYGLGVEISPVYRDLTKKRLNELGASPYKHYRLSDKDARELEPGDLGLEPVDLCITSPPFWGVLSRKRSADGKEVDDYAAGSWDYQDLSRILEYPVFIEQLARAFNSVQRCLAPKAYCIVEVMDLRIGPNLYCLHSDLIQALRGILTLQDIIIWDRRSYYNSFGPIGFPVRFYINKAHSYLLVFQNS